MQWVANGMNVLIGTSRSESKGLEHLIERHAVASNCTIQLTTKLLEKSDTSRRRCRKTCQKRTPSLWI